MYVPKNMGQESQAGDPAARETRKAEPEKNRRRKAPRKGKQGDVTLLTRICAVLVAVTVVAAGYGAYALVTSSQRTAFLSEQTRAVVVATSGISKGDTVAADKLAVQNVPASTVPEGSASDVSQVAGRTALRDVPAKSVMTEADVSGDAAKSLAGRISAGKVAITVSVTQQTGDAGLIRQGDKVTLLGASGSAQSTEASLLAASAKVLACDAKLDEHDTGYTSVTVEVTPEQSRVIATAASTGTVTCVLEAAGQEG